MKLNLGCGPHYAKGWHNADVIDSDEHNIHPDEIIVAGPTLPFETAQFERTYIGHLLEHVPWDRCPDLLFELVRVTEPGGKLGIVGPDAMRTLKMWKEGREPFRTVEAVLEDDKAFMAEGIWDGARHQWNCYEERVKLLLDKIGLTDNRSLDMGQPDQLTEWPVVAFSQWQFAIEVQL